MKFANLLAVIGLLMPMACGPAQEGSMLVETLAEGQTGATTFFGAVDVQPSALDVIADTGASPYTIAAFSDGSFFWFYDKTVACTASGAIVRTWKQSDIVTIEKRTWAICGTSYVIKNTRTGETAYGGAF